MKCKDCGSENVKISKGVAICNDCVYSWVITDNGGMKCPNCSAPVEIHEGCKSCSANCGWGMCTK